MNYKFDGEEISVILVSLITRRNNILGLLNIERMSETYYADYRRELRVVENMLERIFPGSVANLCAA